MNEAGNTIITDLDLIREQTRVLPELREGEDPRILFDPDIFAAPLQELKEGLLHAIIVRDFFPQEIAQGLRAGHIRLMRDFVAANSSTIHMRGRDIFTEFRGEPAITKNLPALTQAALSDFHDMQQRVKERLGPMNIDNIELAAQFGSASILPPSPDLHTHQAGAMHVTAFGSAGLEIMIGEMSEEDMLYLNRLNSEVEWNPYQFLKGIVERPDLQARMRSIPANWLVIMGNHLYHRSPSSLMFEGHDRLAFFAI